MANKTIEMEQEEAIEAYEREAREEVLRETWGYLDSTRKLRLVSFISTSNGKDRPKRRPREVNLLIDVHAASGAVAYQIRNNEIRPRKSRRGLPPDILATEVLTDVPPDERTADTLLTRIRDRIPKMQQFK